MDSNFAWTRIGSPPITPPTEERLPHPYVATVYRGRIDQRLGALLPEQTGHPVRRLPEAAAAKKQLRHRGRNRLSWSNRSKTGRPITRANRSSRSPIT